MAATASKTVPASLLLVCKDGHTVEAHAELLSIASPKLDQLIQQAKTKTLVKAAASSNSSGASSGEEWCAVARASEETPGFKTALLQSEPTQRADGVVVLQCPEEMAGDWQYVVEMVYPVKRTGPPKNWVRVCLHAQTHTHTHTRACGDWQYVVEMVYPVKRTGPPKN